MARGIEATLVALQAVLSTETAVTTQLQEPLYRADVVSSGAIGHLKSYHDMDQTGAPILTTKKRTEVNTIDEAWAANGETEAAAERNTTAASYDDNHFKALLYD